jgi:hypothetical protein
MIADKGYDADWFRQALAARKTAACIPSKSNRKVHIPHDTILYRQRHHIENMFGKLKDWRPGSSPGQAASTPDTTDAPTPYMSQQRRHDPLRIPAEVAELPAGPRSARRTSRNRRRRKRPGPSPSAR